ncbi:hypothetical protein TraAM80_06134 [Trypanosoma rangeli]|uniref:Uncharacterized protein n=1 Tax=Trypanosoma rangeli TaxID=5698 RepID=A0A3R7N9P8_TRYRA|nr:uncharacterized protein TraAM80_06134 [Trypanosoma rangeli]RNF02850.1 hypothetical protein TraAM80_06134 [Trypanosoma rangeli]|eukprot:RNF02850.1 hypothetical protein TraAM80_06134 [Trypanosoma rangeli]
MEGIQSDLDVIRGALARSLCHAAATAAATAYDGDTDRRRGSSAESPGNGGHPPSGALQPSITDAAVDHDGLELKRLHEQLALLSSCEAEKARLEVEVASKEAALRQCVQVSHTVLQREKEQQEQLHRATTALQEKQAELTMWRERHQRLQREADVLRQELDALAGQCDRLELAVGELREAVKQATAENDRLRTTLHETDAECEVLRRRQVEHDAVVEREAALQDELQAMHATNSEFLAYFTAARAEIEARQQYWASVQEEHASLQEALAAAQAAVCVWEARFVSEQAVPPLSSGDVAVGKQLLPPTTLPHDAMNATTVASLSRDGSKGGSSAGDKGESHEALLAALEAKVVDLALHLQQQRVVAQAAEESYATLAAAVTLESREFLEMRRLLAAQRPEWTRLSDTNEHLQAALLARESHVEALQELVVSLLDELTEQSLYCYELETQLAVKVHKDGGVSSTSGSGGVGVPRRSTALYFMQQQQQQQQRLKACASRRPK